MATPIEEITPARAEAAFVRGPLPEAPVALPPDTRAYRWKRRLLGRPLETDELQHERLAKPVALAVFASDNLSSSAYATEEILRVLVPAVGIAAFSLVVPITLAMLVVLALLILSYRETIKAYPTAGGAYMVTRDNFGITTAQVAGVALLTDYVLTVAVSVAAGTAALTSAFSDLAPYTVLISIAFVAIVAYGNLRGVRESGSVFAVPTYFFILNMVVLLGWGLPRMLFGDLPTADLRAEGLLPFGSAGDGVLVGASLFVVLHAFASGGAAVTGVEAISNGVPAFREPSWKNARTTLVLMGSILGAMFLGLSVLGGHLHVAPFEEGTPTVVAQIGELIYGHSALGQILFYSLQAGTMLILVLAANTSFADFPRLASFQAGDNFLPRWLTKRGHRLVFSNGITFLAGLAVGLLIVTGAKVDRLIPLYAIGVFTSFTLSQAGMARHHLREREPRWRQGLVINATGAALSLVVAIVVAVTKFTHGAWLIIVLVPVLVVALLRLARQYELEGTLLERGVPEAITAPILRRHIVLVFVDRLDAAAARAVQYARALTPDDLRAVHFVIDPVAADELAEQWRAHGLERVPLDLVHCPDRRLPSCAVATVARELASGETEVSVLLPERKYRGLWRRILHDQTADDIVEAISQLPHANVTTVPFQMHAAAAADPLVPTSPAGPAAAATRPPDPRQATEVQAEGTDESIPIAGMRLRRRGTVEGRVRTVRVHSLRAVPTLELVLEDQSGSILVVFFGRRELGGVEPGTRLRARGVAAEHRGRLALLNPGYELLAEGSPRRS